jgi:hypothetical protein
MKLNTLQLAMLESRMPKGNVVVPYGGGVNSVAMLILLRDLGIVPFAIVMTDPGAEKKATEVHRDEVMNAWCAANGFPAIAVRSRKLMSLERPRAWRGETLEEETLRIRSLPSVAFGFKKCSLKYKRDVFNWWAESSDECRAEWEAGRKIVKAIGFDADEDHRARPTFGDPLENSRFVPWYPLYDANIDRAGCVAMILSEGLPLPPKSSCVFCPNHKLEEWQDMRANHPEDFARAVAMSRQAVIDQPDVVGLMRCNPHGKRQLHEWADGKYDLTVCDVSAPEQTCECVD